MSSKVAKKKKSQWWNRKIEFSERNQKLIDEMNAAAPGHMTMMDIFTKWRVATYAWSVFLPPYGLYRIWSKESTFERSEKVVWTFMLIMYMVEFLRLILFS